MCLFISEWIASMTAVGWIAELIFNREENLDVLTGLDWIIIPVLNPDGFVFTRNASFLNLNEYNMECESKYCRYIIPFLSP